MGKASLFPLYGEGSAATGATPRITSLLIKPASAVCNSTFAFQGGEPTLAGRTERQQLDADRRNSDRR